MTGQSDIARFNIGHPAPGRERVGGLRLVLSFSLAPVAWSVQIGAITALGGICLGESGRSMVWPATDWAQPAIILINLGALAISIAGLLLSLLNIRQTWRAADAPRGGVMKAGEGRAHWMAVGGFFCALLFIFAIAFNTISVFWGGFCPL